MSDRGSDCKVYHRCLVATADNLINQLLAVFKTTHRALTIFSDSEEDIERKLFHHCLWPILTALAFCLNFKN